MSSEYDATRIGNGTFFTGDCFDVMRDLPDHSVDMVLCDLPYGTTACKWDTVLPFDELWAEYWRIAKYDASIILTAAQPFTSALVMSQIDRFKYGWIWEKERPSNPQLAKKQCLKHHEDICVFYRKLGCYNPQGLTEIPLNKRKVHKPESNSLGHCVRKPYVQTHTNYPRSIQAFKAERGLHPTQKPVGLFEYLIRTYTNPGMTVLDNTAGSGTTAIAAENADRRWICIERDKDYATKAMQRIRDHVGEQEDFDGLLGHNGGPSLDDFDDLLENAA